MAKKVLIIDDDPNIVGLLNYHIKNMGFEILEAHDGLDGLSKARYQNPDLIILDVMLPKVDGYKICRLLKFDDRYKNIPIIIVTAKSDAKDENTGKNVGADSYITKPVNHEVLMVMIKNLIG